MTEAVKGRGSRKAKAEKAPEPAAPVQETPTTDPRGELVKTGKFSFYIRS